jgi:hypothetical protein
MPRNAKPLGAKLFLEGIEVPFIGATFTHTVNEASVAYIDCIPHASLNHIKPRTHVLITIRDYRLKDRPGADGKVLGDAYPYVTAWEGEVFGLNLSKTSDSRMLTLQAIDQTSYWDNALVYYFNAQTTLSGSPGDIMPVGFDYESAKTQNINIIPTTTSTSSFFKEIMKRVREKGLDGVESQKTFFHCFIGVLKELGKVNQFFNNAVTKFELNKQYTINSSAILDDLLNESQAIEWFNSIVGQNTGFSTVRQAVIDLMSLIFHDVVTAPFPAYKKGTENTPARFVFKPNLFMLSPPMCNVFFPDEYSSFTFNRNFFREPTRLMYAPQMAINGQDGRMALPYAYAPESFYRFMFGRDKANDDKYKLPVGDGKDDLDGFSVGPDGKKSTQYFGQARTGDEASGAQREQHFLTNEERYKGIWFSKEGAVPSNNEMRAALKTPQVGDYVRKTATYLFTKKRFQTRELQITSHLKLGVVPGFPAAVLDASPADQNILAYVQSVTHRIYATEGGYTTVTLGYARTVSEQQAAENFSNDPIIPEWLDESIFGKVTSGEGSGLSPEAANELKDTTGETVLPGGKKTVAAKGNKLSEFYETLLGTKGSKALIDRYANDRTLLGATRRLLQEYKVQRDNPNVDLLYWMHQQCDRNYIPVREYFKFLGADLNTADLRNDTSFLRAIGGIFDRKGSIDSVEVAKRRAVIEKYQDALKARRAFRG